MRSDIYYMKNHINVNILIKNELIVAEVYVFFDRGSGFGRICENLSVAASHQHLF